MKIAIVMVSILISLSTKSLATEYTNVFTPSGQRWSMETTDYTDYFWPVECEKNEYTDYCLNKFERFYCEYEPGDYACDDYLKGLVQ